MIKIIMGDEPYLVHQKKRDSVIKVAHPEFNLATFSEFGEAAEEFCSSFPFLEEKKVAVLDCDTLKQLMTSAFVNVCKQTPAFVDVIAVVRNVDKRLKEYKQLKELVSITECRKLYESELYTFIKKTASIPFEETAIDEFVHRIHYEQAECNLYKVSNAIEDCTLYTQNIGAETVSLDTVKYLVENSEEENVFSLVKLLQSGNVNGLKHQTDLLRKNKVPAIQTLGYLHREYRLALKEALFGEGAKSMGVSFISVKERSVSKLVNCLDLISTHITDIKEGRVREEDAVLLTLLELMYLKSFGK